MIIGLFFFAIAVWFVAYAAYGVMNPRIIPELPDGVTIEIHEELSHGSRP